MTWYTNKTFSHVLWKLLFILMVCFTFNVSFAKADNFNAMPKGNKFCEPVWGPAFKDIQDGRNFDVLRADFNCNGIVDTIFAKQIDTDTRKFNLYAYSDINENGKTDLKIRFMPKFLILYFDTNEVLNLILIFQLIFNELFS